jgi:diguanylate cyclase
MRSLWGRYLLVGVLAAVADVLLPVGVGRDALYCLVASSGSVAMVVGARRNRPTQPIAWYLLAAGMGSWVLAGAVDAWLDGGGVDGYASPTDALCLAAYPLVVSGLLLFARGRGREARPTALVDSAILAVGVGLLSWVFLIEPAWVASQKPILDSLVDVAYPLGNVLLFGALVRLAKAPGPGCAASRVVAGLVGAMLAVQSLLQVSTLMPTINVHPTLLDPWWLGVFVVAGAVALHPSMRAFSAPTLTRVDSAHAGQLVTLAAALLIGPAIIAGELIAGVPLRAGPVVAASAVLGLLVIVRMVHMLRRVQDQASTDDLTGLPNRRALYSEAAARLADPQCRRQALLMLDLDRFKEVNDSLGHHFGDQLLIGVGARLGEHLRTADLLVRLGGDEFAILLDNAGHAEAVAMAQIASATVSQPFALADMTIHSTVSIGIALFPEDGTDLGTLLRKADIAMYKAKASGEIHVYGGADDDGATRLRTIEELRTALAGQQLVVHYQPKVDLRTGDVHGVEALVRWDHPTRGLLYPDQFLDLVEEAGLMRSLTRVVLQIALDQVATWWAHGQHLSVAVNLSASSLVDAELPDQVAAILAARNLAPCVLQLEITEEFLMADRERARAILARLRQSGIQISIDDFGTGYSSLSYLRDLPIDELKIDRSFVAPMSDDARAAALVASIIALGHSLGLRMVAEGVEDDVTYTALARLACDQAQGFVVSRPVPAVELDHWLQDRTITNVTPEQRQAWTSGTPTARSSVGHAVDSGAR